MLLHQLLDPNTSKIGLTVPNADDLAELRNSISDLSVSEHLGNSGRLGNFVCDLNDLSTVRMSGSSNTKSII